MAEADKPAPPRVGILVIVDWPKAAGVKSKHKSRRQSRGRSFELSWFKTFIMTLFLFSNSQSKKAHSTNERALCLTSLSHQSGLEKCFSSPLSTKPLAIAHFRSASRRQISLINRAVQAFSRSPGLRTEQDRSL